MDKGMRVDASRDKFFLSTLPPTVAEQRFALAVVAISVTIFLVSVPFAKVPLIPLPVFIAIYQSVLVVSDVITAILLFGNAGILRSRPLLLLASGYLFTGTIAAAHMLTFPGLFAQGGLLGAGPQSTAWLYMFWHGGFALAVIAYFQADTAMSWRLPRHMILTSTLIAVGLVAGLVVLTTENASMLPAIMRGNRYTDVMIFVVGSVWGLIFLAVALAWRQRKRSVLDLWLTVVMCAWLFDVALSAVLNGGRFDLGFYVGRLSGLLASGIVLCVLLAHTLKLYSELAASTAELERSNQELDAFAYAVSHDLRAPLRAMSGFSQALVEDCANLLNAEGKEYVSQIETASHKMSALIDGILSLSRITRGEFEYKTVDISAISTRLLEDLASAEPQRQVSWTVAPKLTAIGDARMLEAALANLIGNAWKYSGKTVVPEIRVLGKNDGGRRWICVADNGAGFDMNHAERLFKPFQRLHRQDEFPGIGIGLATVQRIVHRHGGEIKAHGESGQGATFCFSLPEIDPKITA